MIGKIVKFILMIIFAALVLSVASVAGVIYDDKKAERLAAEEQAAKEAAEAAPKEVNSPFDPYKGGVLDLQMDYEVQTSGDDITIAIVSNLPDGYDLTAEISNIEDVKKELGYSNISASALTPEQMSEINKKTYNKREKNFVTDGVSNFLFTSPPAGQLDLKITSPITKLQSTAVQEMLGDKGANLKGNYVVYLEEVGDKSINFTASFVVEDTSKSSTDGKAHSSEDAKADKKSEEK